MNISCFSDPAAWQRLHVGPLSPFIDTFAQRLYGQGYPNSTIGDKLRVVTKLSQWLERRQLSLSALDEQQVATFIHELHDHRRRIFRGDKTTLQDLLEQLRNTGVVAIDSIVRRALQRAGLEPPCKGAHLLRHTLATGMLRNGACLTESGQLLRHRHPQTTEIYAKVDPSTLGALAQPWPGESS